MINFKEKEKTADTVSNYALTYDYKKTCDNIAEAVNQQLFDGSRSWYWIGEDGCEMCDFDDTDVLSIETMSCIIEKNVSYEEYAEWRDYFIEHPEIVTTNLRTWIKEKRNNKEAQKWISRALSEPTDLSREFDGPQNTYLISYCYNSGGYNVTGFDRAFINIKGEISVSLVKEIEKSLKKYDDGYRYKSNFRVLNVKKVNKDGGKIININF